MRRSFLFAAILGSLVALAAPQVFASYGFFGSYIAIDPDGPGGVSYTFYGMQQPGANFLTGFNGLNLGNFTVGSTAQIAGGEGLTYKNSGDNVDGVWLAWRVDANAFTEIQLNWTSDASFMDAAGNTFTGSGDQKWANIASTPNFLSGLTAGAHTLEVYLRGSEDDQPDFYSSNGGANYTANFNLTNAVPEPSMAILLIMGAGVIYASRRRLLRAQA